MAFQLLKQQVVNTTRMPRKEGLLKRGSLSRKEVLGWDELRQNLAVVKSHGLSDVAE